MSRLDELIAELCPDGVEYKSFSEIADYIRGLTYGKGDELKNESKDGIPVLRANNITLGQNKINFDDVKYVKPSVKIKSSQFLKNDDILICAGSGSKEHVGKVAYIREDMEYAFGGFMAVIRMKDPSEVMPRFMFHNLTSQRFRTHIGFTIDSSTINNLNAKVVSEFKVPVPPMEVQSEIVRLLDNFTDLTAELTSELTAELSARRKQYEYYREQLLSYGESVRKVRIGEVCDVFTGGEPPLDCIKGNISDAEHPYAVWGNGKDLYGYSGTYRIDKDAVVISSIGANTGTVYFHKAFFTPIIRLKVIVPKDDSLDMRFLYHAMSAAKIESKSSSVPNMNAAEIKALLFSLPDIEEQRRVAEILDKYDTLCEDLSGGIPAEIESRNRQYKYYRDKLLTFKEL